MQDFAALLLGARTRAGLTQAQVAIAAGLTPSYLSFIE
ncbi:MAG: helix-turn-helix domain-containing protein, partial [Planctomycetota bacterium]